MQLGLLPRPQASAGQLEAALKPVALSKPASTSASVIEAKTEESWSMEDTPYPHIFVVGDSADAFGAIPAGHNAYYQGEVAARNVICLIKRSCGNDNQANEPLEQYTPGPPAIKVTLGLGKAIFQSQGIVGRKEGEPDDLNAASMWPLYGLVITDDDQMYE